MLRNLFAGSIIAEDNNTVTSYLRTLREQPIKLASLLAVLIIPSAALGWWYYSVAMSVGAVTPLVQTNETSEERNLPNLSTSPEAPTDNSTAPSSSTSSSSTDQIDLKINSSSSQPGAVEVDGQSIPVPTNGSTHQVIENDNGKTTVDINVDSDNSGDSRTRSSTNINLRSSSSTDVDIEREETQ